MIRRSTVVYIIVLLAVAGFYLFLRVRPKPAEAAATPEATAEASSIFMAAEGSPTRILLKAKSGEAVEMARNAENAWALKQPVEAAAEQGSAEAAASQVVAMRILERILKIDLNVVGLKDPDYVLSVNFDNGTERTIRIGVVTPTGSGYYIQDAAGGDVLVVSKSSVDAILHLLASPPYAETPTPSLEVPASGTPGPAETPTP
ncbi:MAG: DUF4340 domain-containing protein [Bacteroidota bacterium]